MINPTAYMLTGPIPTVTISLLCTWLCLNLMLSLIWYAKPGDFHPRRFLRTQRWAVFSLAVALFSLFVLPPEIMQNMQDSLNLSALTPYLKASTLATTGTILLLILALGGLFTMPRFYELHKASQPEVILLVLCSMLGMILMMHANHLLMVYVGLELMSFPLYILVASLRDNARSSEGGLKYFILGSLASGLLLYSFSLLYGITGSLDFSVMKETLSAYTFASQPVYAVAMLFMLAALLFKLAVAPFHVWAPDVYEGAPMPVTAILSTLPKVAAVILLVNMLSIQSIGVMPIWQMLLAVAAAVTMLAGALYAVVQTGLKRLLAYSAISHIGFVLCGIVAANTAGLSATVLYLLIYPFTILGLFAAFLQLRSQHVYVESVKDLKGLSQSRPILAACIMLGLFSLAGVPPLAGFFAKFHILMPLIQAGFTWLAVCAVLASAIGVYYSLNIVRMMYFESTEIRWDPLFTKTLPVLTWGIAIFVAAGWILIPYILHIATWSSKGIW